VALVPPPLAATAMEKNSQKEADAETPPVETLEKAAWSQRLGTARRVHNLQPSL
jgi:hypothetical protein